MFDVSSIFILVHLAAMDVVQHLSRFKGKINIFWYPRKSYSSYYHDHFDTQVWLTLQTFVALRYDQPIYYLLTIQRFLVYFNLKKQIRWIIHVLGVFLCLNTANDSVWVDWIRVSDKEMDLSKVALIGKMKIHCIVSIRYFRIDQMKVLHG